MLKNKASGHLLVFLLHVKVLTICPPHAPLVPLWVVSAFLWGWSEIVRTPVSIGALNFTHACPPCNVKGDTLAYTSKGCTPIEKPVRKIGPPLSTFWPDCIYDMHEQKYPCLGTRLKQQLHVAGMTGCILAVNLWGWKRLFWAVLGADKRHTPYIH